MEKNIRRHESSRAYNKDYPTFLHNKPQRFTEHISKRLMEIEHMDQKNITFVSDGVFMVQSQTKPEHQYKVSFLGSYPDCECDDFGHKCMPCKHMLAIIMLWPDCSWDSLPKPYRESIYFNLDMDVLDGTNTTMETKKICTY